MTNDVGTTLVTTVDSVKINTLLESTLVLKKHIYYKLLWEDLVQNT